MDFAKFIFRNKKEAKFMMLLAAFFFLYYFILDLPAALMLENGKPITNGPFTHVPFRLNIFNFDPLLYYGFGGSLVAHPFFRFISTFIVDITNTFGHKNITVLVIQSIIVSCTTGLIYSYCRNNDLNQILSITVTGVFGFGSYALMTAFVPDSYTYAQFFIVLSVVYFQFINKNDSATVTGLATLGFLNFGITITNIVPFVASTIISKLDTNLKAHIKKFFGILIACIIVLIVLALIDIFLIPGGSWITRHGGLNSNNSSYVAKFNWQEHSHVLYSLFIAPFLFARLQVLDPNGLVAIVTKLKDPFPTVIEWVGYIILLLSVLGLILNLNKRNVWILIFYLAFSIWLHLIYGFGLATHEYDLFLYAGHYIFAIVLGISWLGKKVISIKPLVIILTVMLILINIVQIGNNYKRLGDMRNYISQVYHFGNTK